MVMTPWRGGKYDLRALFPLMEQEMDEMKAVTTCADRASLKP